MKIRIAARQSHLARLQAFTVGDALTHAHPSISIEYFFKESLGDKNLTDPLWKLPERGVFTEDFVSDLLEGRVDLVVHSWKDLPTQARPGLSLLGTLPRADLRDILLFRKKSLGRRKLTLLTSSPRRTFAARRELPDLFPFPVDSLETKSVRGNVLTRLKKLVAGEGDGLFMAKAALDRLLSSTRPEFKEAQKELRGYLSECQWMVLPLSIFPTAPAQGALAIEAKAGREDLRGLVKSIHCEATNRAVNQERKKFSSYGGGCHQKIGLSVIEHTRLGTLEFFYGELDSGEIIHSIHAQKSPAFEPDLDRWPREPAASFFSREALPTENPGTNLFVARSEALPDWKLENQLVWTAGLDSWKKLAAKSVWVNGTSDGLGEEVPEVEALSGHEPNWTKLTHSRSENSAKFPMLATYELKNRPYTLPKAASYFWMSESSFLRALELNPGIAGARHACGPGYTADAIEKFLGRAPEVYINYRHWRNGDPFVKPSR